MIDYNEAIRAIKDNNGFKPNKKEDSFYRTYTIQNSRPIQIRISNHGTHLWTWYDKDYDPSYAINICVVFSEDGSHSSDATVDTRIKDEQGNIIGERKPFEVKQFVYNCQNLDNNDAALINMEIQNTWKNGGFQDPLARTPKQANVIPLRTNNNDNNTDIKKENIMRNKRTYRLTESNLRDIIRESVRGMINEVGDTPEGQRRLASLAARHRYETGKNFPSDVEKSTMHRDKQWEIDDYAANQREQNFSLKERKLVQRIVDMLNQVKKQIMRLEQSGNGMGKRVEDLKSKLDDIMWGFESLDGDLSGENLYNNTFRDSLNQYYRQ